MIVNPDIERYVYGLLPPRDPVLAEMEREAERRGIPIVGPGGRQSSAQLVRISGARRIFELGSAIGYSTIWLPGPPDRIPRSTTRFQPRQRRRGARVLRAVGVASRIRIHVGDALAALASVPGEFI